MDIKISVTKDGEPGTLTMKTPKVKHVSRVANMGASDNIEVLAILVEVCEGQLDGQPITRDDFLELDFSAIGEVEKALTPFLVIGQRG